MRARRVLLRIRWVWVLIGWTLFLWSSRLRNVVNNDELSATGRGLRIGVVVGFVALAIAAAWGVRRDRPKLVAVLVVVTVGYWLIRGTGIVIDGDYSFGFKAVHTALMAVSLSLAGLTARQVSAAR